MILVYGEGLKNASGVERGAGRWKRVPGGGKGGGNSRNTVLVAESESWGVEMECWWLAAAY